MHRQILDRVRLKMVEMDGPTWYNVPLNGDDCHKLIPADETDRIVRLYENMVRRRAARTSTDAGKET